MLHGQRKRADTSNDSRTVICESKIYSSSSSTSSSLESGQQLRSIKSEIVTITRSVSVLRFPDSIAGISIGMYLTLIGFCDDSGWSALQGRKFPEFPDSLLASLASHFCESLSHLKALSSQSCRPPTDIELARGKTV